MTKRIANDTAFMDTTPTLPQKQKIASVLTKLSADVQAGAKWKDIIAVLSGILGTAARRLII